MYRNLGIYLLWLQISSDTVVLILDSIVYVKNLILTGHTDNFFFCNIDK